MTGGRREELVEQTEPGEKKEVSERKKQWREMEGEVNEEMEGMVAELESMLREGLLTQQRYDRLLVKILSGETPDMLDEEEGDGEDEDEDDYDEDNSLFSRSSSLFNVYGQGAASGSDISSDEDDIFLKEDTNASKSLGFSALYKQNSLVEELDNPTIPPPPPPRADLSPQSRQNLNMVMVGGKPKPSGKKALTQTATQLSSEQGVPSKRGFYRQASSFEAAKFNPSLAAYMKKDKFEVILIDEREYPPPSHPPPLIGVIPPPPPQPFSEDAQEKVDEIEVKDQKERDTVGAPPSERDTAASHRSTDTSYKEKQFAMKPELLSAALKKRSQWALNRRDSSEFYNQDVWQK